VIRFIDQMDLKGKKLLIRVDYNVPIKDGVIGDDNRIQASLPTLRYALEQGATLILCSHLGKPKGEVKPELSLKPVAAHLAELLGRPVLMAPDCVGERVRSMVDALSAGDVLLLENLRFHKQEQAGDDEFGRQLAELCDVYCNDAFGTAHRAHASMTAIPAYAPQKCAGFLLKKEWEFIGEALAAPKRPYVAISGGAKVSSKLGILKKLLEKVDTLIVGGAMANTFMLLDGMKMGASLVEADLLDEAQAVLDFAKEKGARVVLPLDFVVGESPDATQAAGIVEAGQDIEPHLMALDVGPKTVELYREVLSGAKTVVWNGPVGLFENDAFADGSLELARIITGLDDALTIGGGGDTGACLKKAGLADSLTFISTGGGSFMEFMEGKELPAFKALED